MNIGFLLNTYPAPSNTFIRGEIEALEELGFNVTRIALRHFAGRLIDPSDIRERAKTTYLLDDNVFGLFLCLLREIFSNPVGLLRAVPAWLSLMVKAQGNIVRHTAYLLEAIALRQATKRLGIHHVHAHFSTNATAAAMLCRLLAGPSYSFTAHGPDEFLQPERKSFEAKIANAEFVIAISDYCHAMLSRLAGTAATAGKIHIVRCGLDLAKFSVAPPVAVDNMTMVCVGRLCPQKGQVHFPEAVATVRKAFPEMKLFLLGDGESRTEIEREIVRHDVGREIVLLGWATNDQVRQLIADSRVLLLPSYEEGLPVVIMEAFAIGRPVISSAVAGIPELVDSTCGWLVTPGDNDQLVRAMNEALACDPEELARMGRNGRARVERLHDRRVVARSQAELIKRALDSRRSQAPIVTRKAQTLPVS